MKKNNEDYLEKIREYMNEYHRLANELTKHYNDEEYLHRLHLLEERVNILKQGLEKTNNNQQQNQQKFLEHHFAAIQLANQHMHQLQHLFDYSYISAELEALKYQMQKILEAAEAIQQDLIISEQTIFNPSPSPGGARNKDEK